MKKSRILSWVFLVALLLVGMMAIPASAVPVTSLSVIFAETGTTTLNWVEDGHVVGDTFTVNIVADNAVDLFAWMAGLKWNASLLNCTAVDWGEFLTLSGGGLQIPGTIDNTAGQIFPPSSETSTASSVTAESVLLLSVTFKTIAFTPPEGVTIEIIETEVQNGGTSAPPDYALNNGVFTFTTIPKITHEVTVAGQTYHVVTESNSGISNFTFDETYSADGWRGELSFNVTGPDGTAGFCNVTIPMDLMIGEPWLILIDDVETTYTQSDNGTHTFLYFTYTHTTHNIKTRGTWVVPEFSAPTLLMALIIVTLAIAIIAKRARRNKPRRL